MFYLEYSALLSKINIQDIKIDDRFRKDLGDINGLARSIKRHGLLHQIVVMPKNENGKYVCVCGARRIAASEKLGWTEIEAKVVGSELDRREAEADENIVREPFTTEEINAIDDHYREKEEAAARQRQLSGKKIDRMERSVNFTEGQSRDRIGKLVGISGVQLQKIRTVKAAAVRNPNLYGQYWNKIAKVKVAKARIKQAYNKVIQLQRIEKDERIALENPNPILNGSSFKLELGPMQEIGKKILDNSIDMIFTDPPYDAKSVYEDRLYDELAKLALRVLKPGGSMAVIVPNGGQEFAYVLDRVREIGMIFHHYIPLLHGGGRDRLHKSGIQVDHKPILWFTKSGPKQPTKYFDMHNVIWSSPPSKDNHEWEQSTEEVEYLIKPLTVKGHTVLDPFMGSGTTVVAAIKLGRKSIGIESDKKHFSNAARRLNQFANSQLEG